MKRLARAEARWAATSRCATADVQAEDGAAEERRTIVLSSRVVGLRHRRALLTSIVDRGLASWSALNLSVERDPNHESDANAIVVKVADDQGSVLGYLPASLCVALSPLVDSGQVLLASLSVVDSSSVVDSVRHLDVRVEVSGNVDAGLELRLQEVSSGDVCRAKFAESIERSAKRFASSAVLAESDLDALTAFNALTFDAQSTYVRLMQRSSTWCTRAEFDDLDCSLLVQAASDVTELNDFQSLLSNLTAPELRSVYTDLLHLGRSSSITRRALLDRIEKHLISQRGFNGEPLWRSGRVRTGFQKLISPRFRLAPDPLASLLRLYRLDHLATLTSETPADMLAPAKLARLGLLQFMTVDLHERIPFGSRAALLELERALSLAHRSMNCFGKKAYDDCVALMNEARSYLTLLPESQLPAVWSSFDAAAIYAECIYVGAKALEKQQNWQLAVSEMMFLLNDVPGLHWKRRRGKIWVRLLLVLDVHLKERSLALSLCNEALDDVVVCAGPRLALQERARKLWRSVHGASEPFRLVPSVMHCHQVEVISIVGRPLNKKTAEKSRFFGYQDDVVSVEELALEHFGQDGWIGWHDEGGLMATLFGILLWDVIWDWTAYPEAFLCATQDGPLDMHQSTFYERRRDAIEARLDDIVNGDAPFIDIVSDVWSRHRGMCCRGVQWDTWSPDELAQVCEAIGRRPLANVLRLRAIDGGHWSVGWPDLALLHRERAQVRMVEVKGPNDRLCEQQRAVLSALSRLGIDCQVLKVDLPEKLERRKRTRTSLGSSTSG